MLAPTDRLESASLHPSDVLATIFVNTTKTVDKVWAQVHDLVFFLKGDGTIVPSFESRGPISQELSLPFKLCLVIP